MSEIKNYYYYYYYYYRIAGGDKLSKKIDLQHEGLGIIYIFVIFHAHLLSLEYFSHSFFSL